MICKANESLSIPDVLAEIMLRSWTENLMISVIQPLITAFGMILNCSFLLVVYKSKSLRTITNIYLINLAVADSLFLLYSFAVNFGIYIFSRFKENRGFYPDNHGGCVIEQIITISSYYVSLYLIFMVSLERYLAICHPLRHRALVSKSRTWNICIATWMLAMICAIPSIFVGGEYKFHCLQFTDKYSHFENTLGGCYNIMSPVSIDWEYIKEQLEIVSFFLIFIGE